MATGKGRFGSRPQALAQFKAPKGFSGRVHAAGERCVALWQQAGTFRYEVSDGRGRFGTSRVLVRAAFVQSATAAEGSILAAWTPSPGDRVMLSRLAPGATRFGAPTQVASRIAPGH